MYRIADTISNTYVSAPPPLRALVFKSNICQYAATMPEDKDSQKSPVLRLIVFAVIATVGLCLTIFTPIGRYLHVDNISRIAQTLGYWGPVIIALIGAISPLLFLPRWPVAFVSGLLYGVFWGTILATGASTVGAIIHFYLAKDLLAPISDKLRAKSSFAAKSVPKDKAFAVLFFLRAFPLSNFVATNLLAGSLKIPFRTYFFATLVGMIPSSIMYAAWGKLMKKPSSSFYILAVATVAFIVIGTLVAQKRFLPWLKQMRNGNHSSGTDAE